MSRYLIAALAKASTTILLLHYTFLPYENYGDWKLQGPCRVIIKMLKSGNLTLCSTPLGHYACCPEVVLIVKLYERERERRRKEEKKVSL